MDPQSLLFQGKAIQSALEGRFIRQYLQVQGFERSDLKRLTDEQARKLMGQYASLKLAEIEARSKSIQKNA
jgi:hypothetical protein